MGVVIMANTLRTVRQIRDVLGWTQEDLLRRVSGQVSLRTITRIENGETSPNRSVRKVIADALGVSVDEIAWPAGKRGQDDQKDEE